MFHLGWFLPGWGIQTSPSNGWTPSLNGPWAGEHELSWMDPDLPIDLVTSLERAGFDYVLIEDTNQVEDTFRGSAEATLRMGFFAPKNDPMPLVPLLTQRTRHIGIVPTVSSSFYPPFLAARLLTTLDHMTKGRVGVNLVTSISPIAAQNFGMETLPPKNVRYEMAEEWATIVKALQESWEPGAVLGDRERGIFADYRRVHRIDFEGQYFRCRGPLNTVPGPQGTVPFVEAGGSPAGRELAARHAISMLSSRASIDEMKKFRIDMHERLKRNGRDPSGCKVMFLVAPILGETDEDARQKAARLEALRSSDDSIETALWSLDQMTGLDFGSFDLETPIEEVIAEMKTRSHESVSSMDFLFAGSRGTLREAIVERPINRHHGLIGSPDTVAAKMGEIMEEVGGDGFLISSETDRHNIAEICDGLAPALRRRGLIRKGYDGKTFRENLLAF